MANVIYGQTKNRLLETQVALSHENIMPGTGIRYVGNRFNVLFYSAGNVIVLSDVTARTVSSLA